MPRMLLLGPPLAPLGIPRRGGRQGFPYGQREGPCRSCCAACSRSPSSPWRRVSPSSTPRPAGRGRRAAGTACPGQRRSAGLGRRRGRSAGMDRGALGAYEQAAARGLAHPLYAHSPGGVAATAQRVARYRPLIEGVAAEAASTRTRSRGWCSWRARGGQTRRGPTARGRRGPHPDPRRDGANLLGMRVDPARGPRGSAGRFGATSSAAATRWCSGCALGAGASTSASTR